MQEEIGRLQKENGQLKKSADQILQGNGQLAGLQEVVTLLQKDNSDLKAARKTAEDQLYNMKAENDELRKVQVINFVSAVKKFTAIIESWAIIRNHVMRAYTVLVEQEELEKTKLEKGALMNSLSTTMTATQQERQRIEQVLQDNNRLKSQYEILQTEKTALQNENDDLINALAINSPKSTVSDTGSPSVTRPPAPSSATLAGEQLTRGQEAKSYRAPPPAGMRTTGVQDLDAQTLSASREELEERKQNTAPDAVTAPAPTANHPSMPATAHTETLPPPPAMPGAGVQSPRRPGAGVQSASTRSPQGSSKQLHGVHAPAKHSDPATWTSPAMWISGNFAHPVHGLAVSKDSATLGDACVVCWDGSCNLLRAAARGGALTYSSVWSVFPGKGLYAVAFGSLGGAGRKSVVGVASMDFSCYVLDSASGSTLYEFSRHQGEVNTLDFQPAAASTTSGESLIASGSDDSICLVWSPASGKSHCVATLAGHSQV